jgi:hypothetical protein
MAARVALQSCLQDESQEGPDGKIARQPYSHEAFVDGLVEWVMGDDIVSRH